MKFDRVSCDRDKELGSHLAFFPAAVGQGAKKRKREIFDEPFLSGEIGIQNRPFC